MESWAVAQAADDLFDAGLVDVREAGDGVAVEMLAAPAREPARGRLQFSRFTPRRPAGRDRGRA